MTHSHDLRARRRRRFGIGALLAGLLMLLGLAAPALHLIDDRSLRLFGGRPHPQVVAVYLSGDMGLRFGMGAKVVPALAAHGVPVVGVSSPVNFGTRRTRQQADAIVAGAIRTAMAETGATRVILMGQSFGADIVSAIAPDLPADLRAHIVAINVVVPAQTVYFRSDPTGIFYHGTPDAVPAAAMRHLDWAPVICIYGEDETDSLCPTLRGTGAQVIGLPGGHFLRGDDKLLVATLLRSLKTAGAGVV